MCEILHVPFKNQVLVSYSPPALLDISPTGLQIQKFWEFVFPVQAPWAGEPMWGLDDCNISLICGPTWVCGS